MVQHHVSHQFPRRPSSGEELELCKSLLRQVVEAIHQDPASFGLWSHLQDKRCDHRIVGELHETVSACGLDDWARSMLTSTATPPVGLLSQLSGTLKLVGAVPSCFCAGIVQTTLVG